MVYCYRSFPNSMFSDIILGVWSQSWWSSYIMETCKCYKVGLTLPIQLLKSCWHLPPLAFVAEEPSSNCYALLYFSLLTSFHCWVLEVEYMGHHTQLGQKCGIRSWAEKSPTPDWLQGAEQFCSNRKEELGDRFSNRVVVLNQEEKEVNLALL